MTATDIATAAILAAPGALALALLLGTLVWVVWAMIAGGDRRGR